MKITRVNLTKEKLARLPPKDRTLLLLAGHVSNEINILQKLLMGVGRVDPLCKVVDIVEAGQALFFMRVLIGKLHEAHVLISKRINGDPDFGMAKGWAGKEQLKRVNQHFSEHGALLAAVRSNISFHSWDEEGLTETGFNSLTEAEPWDFYLTGRVANSFYYASEAVVARCMVELSPSGRSTSSDQEALKAGLGEVFDAALTASKLVSQLFQTLMIEILDRSIDEGVETEEVDIGDAPRMSDFIFRSSSMRLT